MRVQFEARAPSRKSYPSDVSDEEWAFVAPYLTLCREDAAQRQHELREVFNAVRYMVKTGAPWRWMPNDFPPWAAVYQQAQRWIGAGVSAALVHDLRQLLRMADASPRIMSDSPTPWPVCITSPLPLPCSPTPSICSSKVHNSL